MDISNINEIVNLLFVLAIAAAVAGFMAGLLGVQRLRQEKRNQELWDTFVKVFLLSEMNSSTLEITTFGLVDGGTF